MGELVRCKSCGYVMEKGKVHDKCPACGVPAKMFEDYVEKISPKRKLILSLDLHPVAVHFPQAFSITILVLALLATAVHGTILQTLTSAITVLSIAMPFTIALAFAAGVIDGKTRFRKVTTPLLMKKIMFGSVFFILSCALAVIVLTQSLTSGNALVLITLLSVPAVGCASILGLLGVGLINAKFPG